MAFGDRIHASVVPYDPFEEGEPFITDYKTVQDTASFAFTIDGLVDGRYMDITQSAGSVTLTISKALSPDFIGDSYISIRNLTSGTELDKNLYYSEADLKIHCTLLDELVPMQEYGVSLSSNMQDRAQNPLLSDFHAGFTTIARPVSPGSISSGPLKVSYDRNIADVPILVSADPVALDDTRVVNANYKVDGAKLRLIFDEIPDIIYNVKVYNKFDTELKTFNGYIYLEFAYGDADNDGFVDGTGIRENMLEIYYLNENDMNWEKVANSEVLPRSNIVRCKVNHLSVFSVFEKIEQNISYGAKCYPNPRIGEGDITLEYRLKEDSRVNIDIFNASGEAVRGFFFDFQDDLSKKDILHSVKWNGRNDYDYSLAPGLYIVVFDFFGESGSTERMVCKLILYR